MALEGQVYFYYTKTWVVPFLFKDAKIDYPNSPMKCIVVLFLQVWLMAFGQQSGFSQSPTDSAQAYVPCSPRGHVECIRITGREVFQHGAEGRWSEHWWRMSYIGRACEERLGRPKGVVLEILFALPHYMAMGVMNVAGFIKHGVSSHPEKSKTKIQKQTDPLQK